MVDIQHTGTLAVHSPSRARLLASTMAVLLLAGLGLATARPAEAVSTAHSAVVSDDPVGWTPHVEDGAVLSITQIGGTVYVAGSFTSVHDQGSSTSLSRRSLFALDASSGKIIQSFAPSFDGAINSLDTDGTYLYAGGYFGTVNGTTRRRVVKLEVDGTLAAGQPQSPNSGVNEVVVRGDRLYLGGSFTAVGGQARAALAAEDTTTGKLLAEVAVPFTGQYNGGGTNIKRMDITPDGRTLVAVGNFTSVGGQTRSQIAVVDLPPSGPATVSSWATDRFDSAHNACSKSFDTFTRDLDISPDGSYVVVSTTGAFAGGATRGTICDSTSRWELGTRGAGQQPTWVDYTGGDTTYGVAVTGTAVYVGGHMRWQNNGYQGDQAGPGAVPREGIAALDPANGLPLSWNPGRARGVGAQALFATSRGLWVGSDTIRLGGELHSRLAFLPLEGGTTPPAITAASWPNSLYASGPSGLTRRPVDASGTSAGPTSTVSTATDWATARGAFLVGTTLYYGTSSGLVARSFVDGAVGSTRQVDLHDDPEDGRRISFPTGSLSGAFFDTTQHRLYYTVTGDSRLYYRYFTPESEVVGSQTFVADAGSLNLAAVAGMTLVDGRVYFGNSNDGVLRSVRFSDGALVGSPGVVTTAGDRTAKGLFVSGPRPNTAPVASFTQSCTDLTCTFDATSSTDPDGSSLAARWDFGDGSTGTGGTVTHSYASAGAYTVTLTVTDDQGATATSTATARTTAPPPNQVPVASFTHECSDLACTVDATGSSDPDGQVTGYAWDFGDGAQDTGATATHTYAAAGDHTITLTVTDDDGATARTSATVSPTEPQAPASPVGFVDAADHQDNSATAAVALPTGISAGDQLLVVLTTNRGTTVTSPTGAGDFGQPVEQVSGNKDQIQTLVWAKTADGTESGRTVRMSFDAYAKYTATTAAYTHAVLDTTASAAETANTTEHTTPGATITTAGSWLVSYWADKTSETTTWTTPEGTTTRAQTIGTGAGRITSLLADSGPLDTGTTGSLTATADSASLKATTLSLVLRPQDEQAPAPVPNEVPVASFTHECSDLACTVDATGSSDPDGQVTGYAWDFGDGAQDTGATATHTYAAAGDHTITLTVTDDDGATARTSATVSPTEPQAPASPVGFVDAADHQDNSATAAVALPTGISAGDQLLVVLTTNRGTTVTSPTGAGDFGQPVEQVSGNKDQIQTLVWAKTADGTESGRTVRMSFDAYAKYTATTAAYTHAVLDTTASAAETANTTEHTTPGATITTAGSWLVSYWADKTSETTTWTTPEGTTTRAQTIGTGAGRITSLLADSGPLDTGTTGSLTATADSASLKATTLSLVLRPQG